MIKLIRLLFISCIVCFLWTSCSTIHNVSQKFEPLELKKDLDVLHDIVVRFHPGLNEYISKDSFNQLYNHYRDSISSPLTIQEFGFHIVAPIITSLRCGHTSFNYPKWYNKKMRDSLPPLFPLYLKIWGDTMIVTSNVNKKDSILKKGTQVYSINGLNANELTKKMLPYLPTDGYSNTYNYIRLSSAFPYYHRNILGLSSEYVIDYLDGTVKKSTSIPLYYPEKIKKIPKPITHPDSPVVKLNYSKLDKARSIQFNESKNYALLTLNTFDEGYHLSRFFKNCFSQLEEKKIRNLIIDIRLNGGGAVQHYASLSRYIVPKHFKVADTAVAISRGIGKFSAYFSYGAFYSTAIKLLTTKKEDQLFHFRYIENHTYKPQKNNFFDGNVYVLISGPSFSAATLFAHVVKGLPNVTLVGEETGGGDYGNNGLMIPDIRLPNTGIKVRMPLFRIVQFQHGIKTGRGVLPDVLVPPTAEGVRNNRDLKLEKAIALIEEKSILSINQSNKN